MGKDALLPSRLFSSATFSVAAAQTTVIGMAMFGGLAVLPLYLQIVKHATPTSSGLLMLPLVLGLMGSSLGAGRIISRTGRYKIFPVIGSVLMVCGMGLMTRIGADTPLYLTDIYMLTFGVGLGLNMQSLVLAMQNSVDARDTGVASASSTFFRSTGATIGTAVFLSILFSQAHTRIDGEYQKAAATTSYQAAAAAHPAQVASLNEHLAGSLNDTAFLNNVAKPLSHPFYVGFSHAADTVFTVTALLLLLTIVLAVSLKEVPLRMHSANRARALADAEDEENEFALRAATMELL